MPLLIVQSKKKKSVLPLSGPGHTEGLQYDPATDTGYYGFVPASDLITGNALASQIGLTAGTAQFSDAGWFKFYVGHDASCNRTDPKRSYVIYISIKPYRSRIAWTDINGINSIYGDRIETIGPNNYRVRLITGADSDPTSHTIGTPCADNPGLGSEWNELFYRIHEDEPTCDDITIGMLNGWETNRHGGPQIGNNWANYTDSQLELVYTSSNGPAVWAQERRENAAVRRGGRGIGAWSTYSSGSSSHFHGWRPVLELVS